MGRKEMREVRNMWTEESGALEEIERRKEDREKRKGRKREKK